MIDRFLKSPVAGRILISALMLAVYVLPVSAERLVRIHVKSAQEVIRAEQLGVRLLDARVEKVHPSLNREPRRVLWNSENGCVTGLAESDELSALQSAGFEFEDRGAWDSARSSRPYRPSLDELPDQWGWPRLMTGWPAIYGHSATVGDLDGNGDLEAQLSNIENYFYIWQHDGAYYPGYPLDPIVMILPTDPPSEVTWVSSSSIETSALGDIDGDGSNEYIYGCGLGYLCAYGAGGSLNGFPWLMDTTLYSGVPALVDLDGLPGEEIIVNTYPYYPEFLQYPPMLHVFYPEHIEMDGWPQIIPRESESSPAVGDLDGDGDPEIVVGCGATATGPGQEPGPGLILAWHLSGIPVEGYPISGFHSVNSTPVIADIDGDGYQDVIVRCKFQDSNINGVHVFDRNGNEVPGFPAEVISGHPDAACAIGDIDGDGDIEIAFGSIEAVDLGRVYAWHHDGTPVAGFPQLVGATWVEGSVAIGDVSGDGLADIVATTNGLTGDPGRVVAFDYQGNVVADFPLFSDPDDLFTTFECSPAVLDIDGDGDNEIIAGNHDGKVYCWDTPGIAAEIGVWPSLKFGPHRTGCIATETSIGPSTGILEGSVADGQLQPLEGVLISFPGHPELPVVFTDVGGDFQTTLPAPAEYMVVVGLDGYEADTLIVAIGVDSTSTADFQIWRLDPPRELSASVDELNVQLTWSPPESVSGILDEFQSYEVFRDGVSVTTTAETAYTDAVPEPDVYEYYLIALYDGGISQPSETLEVIVPSAANGGEILTANRLELFPAYPNPFNAEVILSFTIPDNMIAGSYLAIYDILGREVVRFSERDLRRGSVLWRADGFVSGLYFARLTSGESARLMKLVLVK